MGKPLPEPFLDNLEMRQVFRTEQGHGDPGAFGTAGSSDAVQIIDGRPGKFVIDHMGEKQHIDAPGGLVKSVVSIPKQKQTTVIELVEVKFPNP